MSKVVQVNYCVVCGSEVSEKRVHGKIRPFCPQCGWIYFSDPKVAVAILIEKEDRILLVRRKNEPAKGLWTLPAGYLDAGEDPREAARRECMEEIGCQVKIADMIDIIHSKEYSHGADLIIFYHGQIVTGELQPGDDVDMVAFFPRFDLPPLAFSNTRQVIDKVIHS